MEITLPRGQKVESRCMYLCSIRTRQFIISLEIGALSVLSTLNPELSEQSLVSIQVILEADAMTGLEVPEI